MEILSNEAVPLPSPRQKAALEDLQPHFFGGWNLFLINQSISACLGLGPGWLFALLGSPPCRGLSSARPRAEQRGEVSFHGAEETREPCDASVSSLNPNTLPA